VSLAYQIVSAVGFMMEIAAGCQLGPEARRAEQLTSHSGYTGEESKESVEKHRGMCRI
jgi:hypothetical protein